MNPTLLQIVTDGAERSTVERYRAAQALAAVIVEVSALDAAKARLAAALRYSR